MEEWRFSPTHEMSNQLHVPAALTPGKRALVTHRPTGGLDILRMMSLSVPESKRFLDRPPCVIATVQTTQTRILVIINTGHPEESSLIRKINNDKVHLKTENTVRIVCTPCTHKTLHAWISADVFSP
jgi:hypothetical protein